MTRHFMSKIDCNLKLKCLSSAAIYLIWAFFITKVQISDQVKVQLGSNHGQPFIPANRKFMEPNFEDENRTVVIGSPGGTVVMDCRISLLHDHTVSWAHRKADLNSGTQDGGSLDLLTIGNSTYTLESRFSSHFSYPHNWGLRIVDLKPSDAGTYLCQLSTFPPKVRVVYLEIHGPMIEIIQEQMVYIAGSHLEVSCVYKNATFVPRNSASLNNDDTPKANEHVVKLLESTRLLHQPDVPNDMMVWYHNGLRFSHRNRRRVKTFRNPDHIISMLSIKSATVEDSGNYSCNLPVANLTDTVRIIIVDGEHSAAIYKNLETAETSDGPSSLLGMSNLLVYISSLAFSFWTGHS